MYRTYDVTPYFSKLIVSVSDEPSKDLARINLDHPGMHLDYTPGKGATTYSTAYKPKGKLSERQYIAIILDYDNMVGVNGYGMAAHEAAHAVNFIFEDIGQKLDVTNDETQTYLIGWIASCIGEVYEEYVKTKIIKKK